MFSKSINWAEVRSFSIFLFTFDVIISVLIFAYDSNFPQDRNTAFAFASTVLGILVIITMVLIASDIFKVIVQASYQSIEANRQKELTPWEKANREYLKNRKNRK